MAEPLISCLCISRGEERFLRKSIGFFLAQRWSKKELIVVVDDTDRMTSWLPQCLRELSEPNITVVPIPELPKPAIRHLGRARNAAVSNAQGDILCQWDDDDYYHRDRLRVQAEDMLSRRFDVSYLGDQLHYFVDTGELYWANWADPGIPGTLMCRRSVGIRYVEQFSEEQAAWKLIEDSQLQRELAARCKIRVLREHGYIYTYVFHGGNAWDRAHHLGCARSSGMSPRTIVRHRGTVVDSLRNYFPHPIPKVLLHPHLEAMTLEGEVSG